MKYHVTAFFETTAANAPQAFDELEKQLKEAIITWPNVQSFEILGVLERNIPGQDS